MNQIREILADDFPDAIVLDGFDEALIGISTDGRAVYDYDLMLAAVARGGGGEDAADVLSYGVLRVLDYLSADEQAHAPVVIHLHG